MSILNLVLNSKTSKFIFAVSKQNWPCDANSLLMSLKKLQILQSSIESKLQNIPFAGLSNSCTKHQTYTYTCVIQLYTHRNRELLIKISHLT